MQRAKILHIKLWIEEDLDILDSFLTIIRAKHVINIEKEHSIVGGGEEE